MIKKSMDESNQGFMKHLGGLELKKISDTQYEFTVEVKEIHSENKRCVTINLELKFISAGKLSDNLIGKVKILKKTKTLVFISCEIFNSSDIVASASGTWKILQ